MTRFYSSFVCICSITFVSLTMPGSFSVNYAEAWVSNCFNQRLRGLHNICIECCVTFRCTNSASMMSKKFLTHWLYVPVMSWKNGTLSFRDDPNVYQRIVHLLQISVFFFCILLIFINSKLHTFFINKQTWYIIYLHTQSTVPPSSPWLLI